jgi:hypothetical protein
MAEEPLDVDEFIETYRKELGQIDEVAQIVLKGHLNVDADLDDALKVIFPRAEFLKQSRLTFIQKARLLRASIEHEDEEIGWHLLLGFNALRNEIAHGKKNEKRSQLITDLRSRARPFGDEQFGKHVATCDEEEVAVIVAALCGGFIIEYRRVLAEQQKKM